MNADTFVLDYVKFKDRMLQYEKEKCKIKVLEMI